MASAPPRPTGWLATGGGDGWARYRHPTLPLRLVVEVRRQANACDPRGVAARLAEQVIAARPGAIVEFRQWGSFGTREVAVQVVGAVDSVLLQAVTGSGADSDPLLVVVVAATRRDADAAGAAFATVMSELVAGGAP